MAGDARLWEALRRREREACEAFVETHYRGVHAFFRWLTRDPEAAADLTQEAFAAFWGSLDDPRRPVPDLKAWLYGIARNRWRKRCRDAAPGLARLPARLDEGVEVPDAAPGPEARLLAALDAEQVSRAVGDLPPDYREALVLRVFQELGYGQVAAALGITPELARWRVHRARRRLRAALEESIGATR